MTRLDNGDLDVPGLGRIRAGFTRTDRGVFGFGSLHAGGLLIQTTEDEPAEVDDDAPMTLTEFQDSIRRVLGADLPLGDVTRLSRYGFQARQAERYRDGRILLAGDAAHQFPATGIGINFGMLDAVNLAWKLAAVIGGWAPAGLLDTYHDERHFAGARALLQTQAQVALRRGQDPAAEALRELFAELLADEQPLRRLGALIAGTDIRYPMPGPSQHALAGTFAPDLTLHTDQGTTSVAELMHAARPVLLDLADRPDLREAARDWQHRIDIRTAETDHRPADALLIRPDAHIAWAAATDEPADTAAPALREALSRWFGAPRASPEPAGRTGAGIVRAGIMRAMTGGLVRCGHCGQKNRVPAAAAGTPRCGQCHQALPWIADADDATFGEVAEAAKIPVVVDLWAPWCGPCRMVSPALEQLARDLAGKVKLVKVNVDTSPQVSQRFGVQAIPTLLVLRRGQVAARQTGAVPLAALRTWVDNALAAAD